MTPPGAGHDLRLMLQPEWDPDADPSRQGLLARDPRVRTLLRILISYPEVCYVLPDRIRLDSTADPRLFEAVGRFLERQTWLVKGVLQR